MVAAAAAIVLVGAAPAAAVADGNPKAGCQSYNGPYHSSGMATPGEMRGFIADVGGRNHGGMLRVIQGELKCKIANPVWP